MMKAAAQLRSRTMRIPCLISGARVGIGYNVKKIKERMADAPINSWST